MESCSFHFADTCMEQKQQSFFFSHCSFTFSQIPAYLHTYLPTYQPTNLPTYLLLLLLLSGAPTYIHTYIAMF